MRYTEDKARELADELTQTTGGTVRLEYVAHPGGGSPSRWVVSGMPAEVYLGAQEAGTAFDAMLAGIAFAVVR